MIICPNCGKEVSEDSVHCGHCGHRLKKEQQKKTMMGLGAIDASWREKLTAAREESETSLPAPQEEWPSSEQSLGQPSQGGDAEQMAFEATQAMEAVSLEEQSYDPTQVMEAVSVDPLGTDATQGMDALRVGESPSPGDDDEGEGEDPYAATAAMEAVVFSGGSSFPQESGPAGAIQEDHLELTEPHSPYEPEESEKTIPGGFIHPVDHGSEWEVGKLDSQVRDDLEESSFPTIDPSQEPSLAEESNNSFTQIGGNPGFGPVSPEVAEEAVGEDKGRKRILLFLGIFGGLFLFCCGTSAVGYFVAGDFIDGLLDPGDAAVQVIERDD